MSANSEEWTIRGGGITANFTSFLGYQYNNASELPDKAIEEGGFFTANKWQTPYNVTIEVAKCGEVGEIGEFLDALDAMLRSLELCEVVTPMKAYVNGNVEGIEYRFHNDDFGPRMVVAGIHVKEVRLVGASANAGSASGSAGGSGAGGSSMGAGTPGNIANPQNPEAASARVGGRVQGTPVSPPRGMLVA